MEISSVGRAGPVPSLPASARLPAGGSALELRKPLNERLQSVCDLQLQLSWLLLINLLRFCWSGILFADR